MVEAALQRNFTLQAIEKFNVQEFQTMGSSPGWGSGGDEVKAATLTPPIEEGIVCNLCSCRMS